MTLVQRILDLAAVIRDTFNKYQNGTKKPKIALFLDDGATGRSYTDIVAEISAAIQNAIDTLRNGVASSGDTLKKLQDQISAITSGSYATEAYVNTAIQNLIGTAPDLLNSLNEIADAIGNDPNFANSVLAQLANKANAADVYNKLDADNLFKTKAEYTDEIGNPDTNFVAAFEAGLLP